METGKMRKLSKSEKSISDMFENMISGNNDEASIHIGEAIKEITKKVILGEKYCDDDDVCKDCEKDPCVCDDHGKKDDDDKDEDKKDDKEKKDKKDKVDEALGLKKAFADSDKVMDNKVKNKVKHENGGKKTLKKHGNSAKDLDDDVVDKTKFKSGGKQPLSTLEKTPKPNHFNDGRDKDLGTTKS